MISFDLKCSKNHVFESWFQSSDAYEKLRKAKHISCPECGDTKISKSLMAPAVAGSKKNSDSADGKMAMAAGEYMKILRSIRKQVEKNCDYVGKDFAEEARKIHYGETETRNIYGEATNEEAESLIEEGIECERIPWVPDHDA